MGEYYFSTIFLKMIIVGFSLYTPAITFLSTKSIRYCPIVKISPSMDVGHKVDILNLNHRRGIVENIIHETLNAGGKYDFVCTGGLSPYYR